jgi:hypothetical protein
MVYKLGKTHAIANVLSILLNSSKPLGVPDQTVDALLFFVEPMWMEEVKSYLEIGQMPKTLNLVQKHKLAKNANPFTLKNRKVYKVEQDNKLHKCLTTSKTQSFSRNYMEWQEDILL